MNEWLCIMFGYESMTDVNYNIPTAALLPQLLLLLINVIDSPALAISSNLANNHLAPSRVKIGMMFLGDAFFWSLFVGLIHTFVRASDSNIFALFRYVIDRQHVCIRRPMLSSMYHVLENLDPTLDLLMVQ
ncbi:hypothetical protein DERP_001194 [Dermatophagoides pteronyssinus]|uniref:Uncharacterized protein n=1 Tax=Dermatophagoides pteronyssinus TaxID=6956 RepID=A0ABQ8JDX8_DERPT|nr:hypothetical protein DERP_001194 [Dermatophagoides pteronyssinus]